MQCWVAAARLKMAARLMSSGENGKVREAFVLIDHASPDGVLHLG
jgi:hypothetical protein